MGSRRLLPVFVFLCDVSAPLLGVRAQEATELLALLVAGSDSVVQVTMGVSVGKAT